MTIELVTEMFSLIYIEVSASKDSQIWSGSSDFQIFRIKFKDTHVFLTTVVNRLPNLL